MKKSKKNTYHIYKFLGTLNPKGFILQLNDMMEVNGPRIRNQRPQKPMYVFFSIFLSDFLQFDLQMIFIFLRGAWGE